MLRGVGGSDKRESAFVREKQDTQTEKQVMFIGFLHKSYSVIMRCSEVHLGVNFKVNLEIKDELHYLVVLQSYQYFIRWMSFRQVTKKEMGSYRAVVSDGRGEDVSTLEFMDDGEQVSANNNPHLLQISNHDGGEAINVFFPLYLIMCPQHSASYL